MISKVDFANVIRKMRSQLMSSNVGALKAKNCVQEKGNVAVEAVNANQATQDDAAKSKCKHFVVGIMTRFVQVSTNLTAQNHFSKSKSCVFYNNNFLSCCLSYQ